MSSDQRRPFPFDEFEPKWQDQWEGAQAFRTPNPGDADFDASKFSNCHLYGNLMKS
jgi:leucyl-tRNA synthetase